MASWHRLSAARAVSIRWVSKGYRSTKRPTAAGPKFEAFSKLTSGIQSIAVVVGLIITGWWALQTFIFQNPAFYEKGREVAGLEPEFIKTELSVQPLDTRARTYEVILSVSNVSKTLSQIVRPTEVEVLFFEPGESKPMSATFSTSQNVSAGVLVPSMESRDFHFLAKFPRDEIYIVESNICAKYQNNCTTQRYVYAQGG